LAALAAGFTVASVIIFFLGILIGQWIEERKLLRREEPLVKIPVQPLPRKSSSAPGTPPKEEMTFYDTLAKSPTAIQATPGKAVKEIKPAEKAVKPSVKETKAAPQEETAQPAQKATEKASAEKEALMRQVKKEATPQKGQEAEGVEVVTAAKEAGWAVQVNAYPDERSAQTLVKKLQEKGYDAYMVTTSIKGRTWYRVRVGYLTTREEAKELQETLKSQESFTKAFMVSPQAWRLE
jgi:DedD protein